MAGIEIIRERVAVAGEKGGITKTNDAIAIAIAAAERLAPLGERVLVVDLDPQAAASRRLGAFKQPVPTTLDHIILGKYNGHLAGAVVRDVGGIPGLDLLASDKAMSDVEMKLFQAQPREGYIEFMLDELDKELVERGQPGGLAQWAKIIIDCPPNLRGLLCINGLWMADRVVTPYSVLEEGSIDSLYQTVEEVAEVRLMRERAARAFKGAEIDGCPSMAFVVVTCVKGKDGSGMSAASRHLYDSLPEIAQAAGVPIASTIIPYTEHSRGADWAQVPLLRYASSCAASIALRRLAVELFPDLATRDDEAEAVA
jgi:cellulose biosynthesis protein BcsQ